ncbi:MAG: helix-turn-helix transcriptional regulator [Clostridia bacterium]|nr:helix-turn-helix transcriptional regulator [Clostridia bacterium]
MTGEKRKITLPAEKDIDRLSSFFSIFGDSTRIRILLVLAEGEFCVADIASMLEMGVSAISHQLRILRQAQLVKSRRNGKNLFYSLADYHVHSIISQGVEHINE